MVVGMYTLSKYFESKYKIKNRTNSMHSPPLQYKVVIKLRSKNHKTDQR